MKKIAVLGSTGSIGQSSLKVAKHLNLQVLALAAHSNIDLLQEQAMAFDVPYLAVYDSQKALELQKRLPDKKVLAGKEGVCHIASLEETELVIAAIVGMAGIEPCIKAIEAKKTIALANKEVLVAAGPLIKSLLDKHQTSLLPVDSEHSAVFQLLQGEEKKAVRRIILTASGGPFFDRKNFEDIRVEDAIKHPNWSMGAKISVDSSTLMNKGLEVIEASVLFGTKNIDVLVHRQSLVHSFVEFEDASLKAQVSIPDMVHPIQYAVTYPKRMNAPIKPLDFSATPLWTFEAADTERFPCLQLAYDALEKGGSAPCFLNAANEVLVQRFLKKAISWLDISKKLAKLLDQHQVQQALSLEEILSIDTEARKQAALV